MSDRLDESIFGATGDDAPAVPESRAARRVAATVDPDRGGRGRRLLVLMLTLGLVGGAGFLAVTVLKPLLAGFGAETDYPGPGSGSVVITVNPGDTGRAIGSTLQGAGVVKSASAFLDAWNANPDSASVQPGSYLLEAQMKAADALAVLLDPASRQVPRVTIREGLWASEVYAVLSKATGTPLAAYQAAAKDPAALGLPAAAKGNVEGYLFPASYELAPEATAAEQLKAMVGKAVSELDRLGVAAADLERTVILASIAEAEGKTASDRTKIVRVLLNRLAIDRPLELDSTVSYVAKRRAITTTDRERASTSPYNTYRRVGLPPGPIASPGVSALTAAAHPADGTWLYFVAINPATGETRFATTFAEHQRNVVLFQQWCADNPGTC